MPTFFNSRQLIQGGFARENGIRVDLFHAARHEAGKRAHSLSDAEIRGWA